MVRPIVLSETRHAVLEALAVKQRPVDAGDINLSKLTRGRVTGTLHDMRKIGLVTFVESDDATGGSGHHQGIKRIEITEKGRKILMQGSTIKDAKNATPADADGVMQAFLGSQRASDVIPLSSRYRALPPAEAAVAMGDVVDGTIGQDRESYTDDQDRDSYTSAVPEPIVEPEPVTAETKPEFPTPMLDSLRAKQAKVAAAASLLEEAGLDDEAIRVLDALRLTPIEAEYIEFAKTCGR